MPTPLASRFEEFVRQHGPWTAHNVHLGEGLSTMGARPVEEELALRRILQGVADLAGRPLSELRVLDLGCNEGLYAIEFARHGAEVVGIEGREPSLRRARFVKELLGLERLSFHLDDVRHLSVERHGRFDVVLCIGLLYHLNESDVLDFLERMASVCDRLLVVHTHISVAPRARFEWKQRTYWGHPFLEHLPDEEAEEAAWASLDNPSSFWLTRASLLSALQDCGFTTVAEMRVPWIPWQPDDHVTLAALRGMRVPAHSVPGLDEAAWTRWPERRRTRLHAGQKWYYAFYRRSVAALPRGLRGVVRRGLRRARAVFGLWWARPAGPGRGPSA